MTREQFDHLLSAYSSGTISTEEKATLFRAALENQEFFDALGDEETLREVLANKPQRQRLQEILDPIEEKSDSTRLIAAMGEGTMFSRKAPATPTPVIPFRHEQKRRFRPWQLALAGTLASAVIGTFVAWKAQKPEAVPVSSTPITVALRKDSSVNPPEAEIKKQELPPNQQPSLGKREETVIAPRESGQVETARAPLPPSAAPADTPAAAPASTESGKAAESQIQVLGGRADTPSAFALRTSSASPNAFTWKLAEGKVNLEIMRPGLLYVIAVKGGSPRIIENGATVAAGNSRIIDPGDADQLVATIVNRQLDNPTPELLTAAGGATLKIR